MPIVDRLTPKTRVAYDAAMTLFAKVAGAKEAYAREDVSRAVEVLERTGYSSSYIGYVLRVAKAIVGSDRWPKDVKYKPCSAMVCKPTLEDVEIRKLVQWARSYPEKHYASYLLLATLYGIRRAELALAREQDYDSVKGCFLVRTAKSGSVRFHEVPAGLRAYIGALPEVEMSVSFMNRTFDVMARRAGVVKSDRCGWHAIRRSLVSGLIRNGAADAHVRNFMRWKSDGDIMDEYVVNQGFKIDRAIFDVHPFLKMWEE